MSESNIKKFFFYNEKSKEKITLGSDMLFGRKKKADYILEDSQTSGNHFFISIKSRNIYIEDLNSTNKTFLNNKAIRPSSLYQLEHGDIVRAGNIKYIFIHADIDDFTIPEPKLHKEHEELSIILDKAVSKADYGTKSVQSIIRFEKNDESNMPNKKVKNENDISIPVICTPTKIEPEELQHINESIKLMKKTITSLNNELEELEKKICCLDVKKKAS